MPQILNALCRFLICENRLPLLNCTHSIQQHTYGWRICRRGWGHLLGLIWLIWAWIYLQNCEKGGGGGGERTDSASHSSSHLNKQKAGRRVHHGQILPAFYPCTEQERLYVDYICISRVGGETARFRTLRISRKCGKYAEFRFLRKSKLF